MSKNISLPLPSACPRTLQRPTVGDAGWRFLNARNQRHRSVAATGHAQEAGGAVWDCGPTLRAVASPTQPLALLFLASLPNPVAPMAKKKKAAAPKKAKKAAPKK